MSDAAERPAPPRPPRRRRWAVALAAVALALLLPLATFAFLAGTGPGLAVLAALAQAASAGRLEVQGASGRLVGPLRIGGLRWIDTGQRMEIDGLELDWDAAALRGRSVLVRRLAMERVKLASAPSGEPPSLPADLTLPVSVEVRRLELGTLQLAELSPGGAVEDSLRLDRIAAAFSSDGRQHRLQHLQVTTPYGALAGEASLAATAPFDLRARGSLEGTRERKPYRARAEARGPLDRFEVQFHGEGFDMALQGTLAATPFAPVPFARLQAALAGVDPARFGPGAPRARLEAVADLRPEVQAGGAAWVLTGPVEVKNTEPGPADEGRLPLESLRTRVRWQGGELLLADLELALTGQGRARGEARWKDDSARARFAVTGLDLRRIAQALQPTRLAGDISFEGGVARQSVQAQLRDAGRSATVDVFIAENVVTLRSARLRAGEALLEAAGTLALSGGKAFDLRGRLKRFDPSAFASAAPRARLDAELTARGALAPQLLADVRFTLQESVLHTPRGARPLAGRGDLQLQPGRLARLDLDLDLAGNTLHAAGSYGAPGDRLALTLDAPRLEQLGYGFGGRARGAADLGGTPQQPAGRFEIDADALRLPGDIGIASLRGSGELQEGVSGPFRLALELGRVVRNGAREEETILVQQGKLAAEGTRDDHRLDLGAELGPGRSLRAAARGALEAGPAWTGELRQFEHDAPRLPLRLAAPVTLRLAPGNFELGAAELQVRDALLRLRETRWRDGALVARGQASNLGVALALEEGEQAAGMGRSLRLGARWDLELAAQARGEVRLYRESGDVVLEGDAPVSLGLSALELQAVVAGERLDVTFSLRGERAGVWDARASAELERADDRWRLAPDRPLQGDGRVAIPAVDWVGPLLDPNLQTGGALAGHWLLSGTPRDPRAEGSVRGEALRVVLVDQGVRLAQGFLEADFTQERLELKALRFAAPVQQRPRESRIDFARLAGDGGRLSASGSLTLADGRGEFLLEAEHLAVLQRVDRWLMLSGEGRITTGRDAAAIRATLRADAGYFELPDAPAPSLSEDVMVLGRSQAPRPFRLDLDVATELGRQLHFSGRGLDTRLTGTVRLRADKGGPLRASGSIRARDGTFDAYGRELTIERGILNFQGPLDNPGLNVVALRKGLPVEAGVEVSGTVRNPRVRLVSEPNVPDADKLSWIILGRSQDQVAGADAGLLLSAAGAILGRGEGPGVTEQLARGLGFDEISVRTGDISGSASRIPSSTVAGDVRLGAGEPGLASQIVTVGKRLSSSAYLSYEQSLMGTASVVKLTYELSRRLSLVGRTGTDNAVDLFYSFALD